MRRRSIVAPDWWDYTTLDDDLLSDVAKLSVEDLAQLSRDGFNVVLYDTLESFYLAEALEYVEAWSKSTPDNPVGVCGPIGPTEHLPLVTQLVNALELNLGAKEAHFWGMDEWVVEGKAVDAAHPLSFQRADMELCFNRIEAPLRMPESNLHFPIGDLGAYSNLFDSVRCAVMQGGQGDVKHWAFNDPVRREGPHADAPPAPEAYRQLAARKVDLHPMTILQNARTSGGGKATEIPTQAMTVGPVETWKCDKVSIWQAGMHDNPFGMRLTAFMVGRHIVDTAVPMSLLADHPCVQFNYYRPAIGTCQVEMH